MRLLIIKPLAMTLAMSSILLAGPAASIWIDVPFVKQEHDGCGAACVVMVTEYWEKAAHHADSVEPQKVYRQLYRPSAKGVYASQMESYFRAHGFRVFAFHGSWSDLDHHLSKGRPLIVCLGDGEGAPLHYVVVAGLNTVNQTVLVNDPAQRKLLAIDRAGFEKRWAAEGDWTLLALPR